MRRLAKAILVLFIIILAAAFSVKPLVIALTKKQLAAVFVKSKIIVKGCSISPASGLSLSEIEIKREGVYSVNIDHAALRYKLSSVFKPDFLSLSLKDILVQVNAPSRRAQELVGYLRLKPGRSPLGSIEVSGLSLDVKTKDLTLKSSLSVKLNTARQELESAGLRIEEFQMLNAKVKNASIELVSGQGSLNVETLSYDKASLSDIKGRISLQGKQFLLSGLAARTIDGTIEGEISADLGQEPQYFVDLKCANLAIENLIRDFKLKDKFDMSGRLSGTLKLEGAGAKINILGGDFSTLPPGGTLVITDTRAVEGVIKASRQPADLLVESLKNYRYNTGVMTLGIEGDTIILKIRLEGDAGKRSLDVAFHGLNIAKEIE